MYEPKIEDDLLAQTGISDEITRLRAENERLREALKKIILASDGTIGGPNAERVAGIVSGLNRAASIAREALEAIDGS